MIISGTYYNHTHVQSPVVRDIKPVRTVITAPLWVSIITVIYIRYKTITLTGWESSLIACLFSVSPQLHQNHGSDENHARANVWFAMESYMRYVYVIWYWTFQISGL